MFITSGCPLFRRKSHAGKTRAPAGRRWADSGCECESADWIEPLPSFLECHAEKDRMRQCPAVVRVENFFQEETTLDFRA